MVTTTTVRVEKKTQEAASELANELGTTIGEVFSRAVGSYKRQLMLASYNRAYTALSEGSELLLAETAELARWDRIRPLFTGTSTEFTPSEEREWEPVVGKDSIEAEADRRHDPHRETSTSRDR